MTRTHRSIPHRRKTPEAALTPAFTGGELPLNKKYQGLLVEEFDKMAEEFGFQVVDARRPPEEIQEALRARILPILKEGRSRRAGKAATEKAAVVAVEKSVETPADKPGESVPVMEPAPTA
jgi:hypothetical protein